MNVKKDTIARTVVLAVALINQTLTMLDLNPLPFAEEEIYTTVTLIVSTVATIWAWWKNNSFTKSAVELDEKLKTLKADKPKLRQKLLELLKTTLKKLWSYIIAEADENENINNKNK